MRQCNLLLIENVSGGGNSVLKCKENKSEEVSVLNYT